MAVLDPKKNLTKFLTEIPARTKDDKGVLEPSLLDLSTEFPTSESVRLQLYYRTLGDDFQLSFFDRQADKIARIMWSFVRGSRKEAVTGLVSQEEEAIVVKSKMFGTEEE